MVRYYRVLESLAMHLADNYYSLLRIGCVLH